MPNGKELATPRTPARDWVVFRKTRAFKALTVFFGAVTLLWTAIGVTDSASRGVALLFGTFMGLLTLYFSLYTLAFKNGVLMFFGFCRVNGKPRLSYRIPADDLQDVRKMHNYGIIIRKNGDVVEFDTNGFSYEEFSAFMTENQGAAISRLLP